MISLCLNFSFEFVCDLSWVSSQFCRYWSLGVFFITKRAFLMCCWVTGSFTLHFLLISSFCWMKKKGEERCIFFSQQHVVSGMLQSLSEWVSEWASERASEWASGRASERVTDRPSTKKVRNKQEQIPPVSVIIISKFQGKLQMVSSNSASVFHIRYRGWPQMFSWLGPLGSNRENVRHLFSCCSEESFGCQAVFVPDVDYFGDLCRTGNNPRKQEPFGSVCQANSWVFLLSIDVDFLK